MAIQTLKRAEIYTRVSTSMQVEDGSSIDNQIEKLETFCTYNNYELTHRFSDPGVSGRKFENRPQFMEMIRLAEKKEIDVVVVYSLSRFGRNLKDTLKWIEHLEKNGVSFYTQDFQADTGTSHGKLMMQMIAAFAEFESNQRSEMIVSVMGHLKDQEKVYCGPTPLGFIKENDQLVVIQEEMTIVKSIFEMKEQGLSYLIIASSLNKAGVKGKKGGRFGQNTIKRIIDNKIYQRYLK